MERRSCPAYNTVRKDLRPPIIHPSNVSRHSRPPLRSINSFLSSFPGSRNTYQNLNSLSRLLYPLTSTLCTTIRLSPLHDSAIPNRNFTRHSTLRLQYHKTVDTVFGSGSLLFLYVFFGGSTNWTCLRALMGLRSSSHGVWICGPCASETV
jgi:hypothetical protein